MVNKQAYNPIGGVITTNSNNYEVINTDKYGKDYSCNYRKVYNLTFKNIGSSDLIFKVNNGERMPLKASEGFNCGEYEITSFKIYTNSAKVQFSGFISEPYNGV